MPENFPLAFISFFSFTSLRMHAETPKTISFQYKKVKVLHKYCPAAIETAFSTKFVFERYVFVAYSVALNISFKST